MEFADIVKNVRFKLNLSQSELAEALNVSFATINRWENNKVEPSKLGARCFMEFCEDNFIDITKL